MALARVHELLESADKQVGASDYPKAQELVARGLSEIAVAEWSGEDAGELAVLRARAALTMGVIDRDRGAFTEAERWLAESVAVAMSAGDLATVGNAWNARVVNRQIVARGRGLRPGAIAFFDQAFAEAHAAAKASGDTALAADLLHRQAVHRGELGDPVAAVGLLREALRRSEQRGDASMALAGLVGLARAELARGDRRRAVSEWLGEAETVVEDVTHPIRKMQLHTCHGQQALADGAVEDLDHHIAEAQRYLEGGAFRNRQFEELVRRRRELER